MKQSRSALLHRLADWLGSASATVVLTGAGVSAESSVPTFRDAQTGLWARYDPQELATEDAFRRHPDLVWQWYQWRRALVAAAIPNAAHYALAALAGHVRDFTLITQNVDDLHERAGSSGVIHLHGNLLENRCFECAAICVEPIAEDCSTPPACARCGAPVRPSVVWFGEPLPQKQLERARIAMEKASLVLVVGSSARVHPAAGLAVRGCERGARLVEINPAQTPLTPLADLCLRAPAGAIMTELMSLVRQGA